MQHWDDILKAAKGSHTRKAWETLFKKYHSEITNCNQSKHIEDLTKILLSDPQSSQYDSFIFVALVKGCHSAWNLELAPLIATVTRQIACPDLAIETARLFLEKGELQSARDLCKKALKYKSLNDKQRITLQLTICNTWSEAGNHLKATKAITSLCQEIDAASLPLKEEADFKSQMARMHFFLGQYGEASDLFREASFRFIKLEDWEAAAKALFNTAACAQNAGRQPVEQAYSFVEESRLISEKHGLKGPLSHCEAFYGLDSYNHGYFSEARDHFRKALDCLPASDQSYRRLHIISMLTLSYLALGNFTLARKFGSQTLALAEKDQSNRYQSRYRSLEAELIWESGKPVESQRMLQQTIQSLCTRGIHTLEELSTYNRFCIQSAMLGQGELQTTPHIDPGLKKHMFTWMDHDYTKGLLYLNQEEHTKAKEAFVSVSKMAHKNNDRYHQALALSGQIHLCLMKQNTGGEFLHFLKEFKIIIRKMADTPMKVQLNLFMAAHAWQQGDIRECLRTLKACKRFTRSNFADQFVVSCWIATLEGKSLRLQYDWQHELISRYTRIWFAPYLIAKGNHLYEISKNYVVDFSRHPILGDIIDYLLSQPDFSADAQDLQQHVWKQILHSHGWKQKIRNTLMRIRDQVPFSMAPLIIQNKRIKLNSDAIKIQPIKKFGSEREEEVYHLLCYREMTSSQLSERLDISKATTKRILSSLIKKEKIENLRQGRKILYRTSNT